MEHDDNTSVLVPEITVKDGIESANHIKTGLVAGCTKQIGVIRSLFTNKNGTPRQPTVCHLSRGSLTIDKLVFNNPEHSLQGLETFSHIWVIFVFHQNNNVYTKAKVHPPRLNGAKVGLFSTRCPYRPNPIGLTLVKLEKIEGATLVLSGLDMVDGTPVLDIKPYIPEYDKPAILVKENWNVLDPDQVVKQSSQGSSDTPVQNSFDSDCEFETTQSHHQDLNSLSVGGDCLTKKYVPSGIFNENDLPRDGPPVVCSSIENIRIKTFEANVSSGKQHSDQQYDLECDEPSEDAAASVPDWIQKPPIPELDVHFTDRAVQQLQLFDQSKDNIGYKLNYLKNPAEVQRAISDILKADPRSPYRRKHCQDSLYFFSVDTVHVTCWFDGNMAEVLKIQPDNKPKIQCTRQEL